MGWGSGFDLIDAGCMHSLTWIWNWLKKFTWANVMLNNFWTYAGILLSPLLSSQNNPLKRSKLQFVTFLDFWTIFLNFSQIDWKKFTWANVLFNNFWMYDGIMLCPLLSSQNKPLRRSEKKFVTFGFWTIFLDFSHIDWKSSHGQMLCWISSGFMMESCYLLF